MAHDSLRDLLNRLHKALGGKKALTKEDRALLEQLAADIKAVLTRPGAPGGGGPPGLAARLESAVRRFEVTHPDLTAVMAQVSKKLSDMGI